MHSRWGFYISGERFNNLEGRKEAGKNSVFLRDEKDLLLNKDDKRLLVAKEIKNFINFFSEDRKVFIISSIPEVGFDVPKTVARSIKFKKSHSQGKTRIAVLLSPDCNVKFLCNFLKLLLKAFDSRNHLL